MRHRFTDYILNEPGRCLLHQGRPVSVEPMVFDLLILLIHHRDRVVLRDELVEHLWPGVSVSDSAVSKCVSRAREAIGDTDPTRRKIRTLHRRGFQFVAAIESAAAFCDGCGSSLPDEDTSCTRCDGAGSRGQQPPPLRATTSDGERRQLSVLCCTLVNPTPDSRQRDDERRSEIVRRYHLLCSEIVGRYDGYLANAYEDDLVVYFGYPRAHEDDAARAVQAALEIIAAVREMQDLLLVEAGGATAEIRLAARIGIDTGSVVVRGVGSHGIVVGETATVAAGLRAAAKPGAVVVSAATLHLMRATVATRDLGDHEIAEVARPVAAHRVLKQTAALPALDVAAGRLTPFVGRQIELQTLVERWEQIQVHDGQTVLISGEAGIGKSRLVHGLHLRLTGEDHVWLEGHCSRYAENTAFHPLIALLEQAFGFTTDDTAADKSRKLQAALEGAQLPLAETVSLFADFLALPPSAASSASTMSPQVRRRRTIEATVGWILALGEVQPVVLVLEDLQWCDPSSIELIGELIAQVPTARVMVVLTARPDFTSRWPATSNVTPLVLHRFTARDARAMVEMVVAKRSLPASAADRIVERADGNPLYLEELSRTFLERGPPVEASGGGAAPRDSTIPATLQSSLLARLDQLGEARSIAQLGATIGESFSYELLQSVARIDDATLRRYLAMIVENGLLYQRGWPPRATYVFKHSLVQEAAHESLLSHTRQQYHGEIARALIDRFPQAADREPERVASHLESACVEVEAATWWRRAGEQALARAANNEAITHFRRALARLEVVPESAERHRQELEAQLGLAPALMAIQGWASSEVEAACRRARELCERLDASDRLLPAHWGQWTVHFLRGELEVALRIAESVHAMAHGAGHSPMRVMGHHAVGFTRFFRGELAEATRHAEHGIALYSLEQEREIIGDLQFSSTVALRSFLAASQWLLGRPDRALTELDGAAALVDELAHPPSRAFFLSFRIYLHFYRGEVDRTLAAAEELLSLSNEEGFLLWAAVATIYRGWARAKQGDLAAGIGEMQDGLVSFRGTGSRLTLVQVSAALAEVLLAAGRRHEAEQVLADGLTQATSGSERFFEAELHRLAGEARTDDEQPGAECFEQALALARSQRARSLELRAATSLARLWGRQRNHTKARRLLAKVHGSFTEGLGTADLKSATALLAQLD